ncbi:ATP-binding protein [Maribacter chungangensis]|uniref:histidine kinase n=1 Tax=Maribacter chungangensis TaxID=1069117 RepID=A0ABW3B853_9FLAO
MFKKRVLFFLFILSFSLCVKAQFDSIIFYKEQINNLKETKAFTPRDTSYIILLNKLSSRLKHYGTDSLGILSKEALSLSRAINYKKGENDALANLAIFELINGNFENSLNYNNEVLNNIANDDNPELAANIYNIIGQIYFSLNNYPESYKNLYQSLLLAQQTNNTDLIIKINSNLGTLFSLLEEYDDAAYYYKIALDSIGDSDTSIIKAGIQCNLGYLYLKKNDSTTALDFLRKSLPTLENQQIVALLPIVYLTFGEVYSQFGNFEKSIEYFNMALPYYKTLNDARNNGNVLKGLGTSHLALNNLNKSEQFLNGGVQLFKKVNYKTGLEQSYHALYQLYKTKKSLNTALSFLELSQGYKDSIFKEKSVRDIAMLKAKLIFEEDQEAIKRESEKKIMEQKKYVQWGGLGLVCTIFITILVFQVNKTERKLNKELESQRKSLALKQDELNKINNNQDKLFSIIGHDLRGPIVSLKQLLGLALQDETGIQHYYRFAPKLKKDVDHIHFTVDNLLNWGKTQMQGEPLNPVQINVKEELFLIEVLFRDILDKKSIIINKENLDDLTLVADADHFRIIFRNLISNALKFTPQNGHIWLTSYQEEDTVVVQVKDNGIGMSEDVVNKIFNPSDYHTTFGTNNERGTGLGLKLCKEMVLKNNGDIWVKSTVGKGSVFSVRFSRKPLV